MEGEEREGEETEGEEREEEGKLKARMRRGFLMMKVAVADCPCPLISLFPRQFISSVRIQLLPFSPNNLLFTEQGISRLV